MDLRIACARLRRGPATIGALVADVDGDEARFRPATGRWSILEVVGHLALEEVEDFRRRFLSTIADPEAPWPRMDPQARVREERFDEYALLEVMERFATARQESVAQLASLTSPDLDLAYRHPRGALRAGDLLASWVAHDLLHVRQIARNRYAYWERLAAPYGLTYAG
jgi:hypothetical protein